MGSIVNPPANEELDDGADAKTGDNNPPERLAEPNAPSPAEAGTEEETAASSFALESSCEAMTYPPGAGSGPGAAEDSTTVSASGKSEADGTSGVEDAAATVCMGIAIDTT